MGIKIKFVEDAVAEQKAVENKECDFAIFERSSPGCPNFNISTLRDGFLNPMPDGWTLLYNGGTHGIKRFAVPMYKDELYAEISRLCGEEISH